MYVYVCEHIEGPIIAQRVLLPWRGVKSECISRDSSSMFTCIHAPPHPHPHPHPMHTYWCFVQYVLGVWADQYCKKWLIILA